MDGIDHTTPNSNEVKLIIDNSLLGLEKRMTKSITDTLTDQNKTYMTEIVKITGDLARLDARVEQHSEKIRSFKGLVATVSSVTGVLGGLIGFFIAQLAGK
jgi:hypothetical protein